MLDVKNELLFLTIKCFDLLMFLLEPLKFDIIFLLKLSFLKREYFYFFPCLI